MIEKRGLLRKGQVFRKIILNFICKNCELQNYQYGFEHETEYHNQPLFLMKGRTQVNNRFKDF